MNLFTLCINSFMFSPSVFIASLHVFTSHGSLQVMTVQIKCFQEIITIGYRVYRSYELPWFRTLSW